MPQWPERPPLPAPQQSPSTEFDAEVTDATTAAMTEVTAATTAATTAAEGHSFVRFFVERRRMNFVIHTARPRAARLIITWHHHRSGGHGG